MWGAVTQISTGVALTAFLAAIALSAYRSNLKSRAERIHSLPPPERMHALDRELNIFGIDAPTLSKEQQYQLALREIELRRTRLFTTTAVVMVLAVMSGIVAAFSIAKVPPPDQTAMSSICQFSDGWIDYAPRAQLPIGFACNDGTGNTGYIVLKGTGSQIAVSAICQFSNGWHDYTPMTPLRTGSTCQDGLGNYGKVVFKGQQTGPQI
jgi:hypothetical protein